MNDILDTKIKNKNKKITTLATKAERKIKQNKIEKLNIWWFKSFCWSKLLWP